MTATIVICSCGHRMKVMGLEPGKVARCPRCHAIIRPPAAPAPVVEAAEEEEDEWNWHGIYGLVETEPPPQPRHAEPADPWANDPPEEEPAAVEALPDEDEWNWKGTYGVRPAPPALEPRPLVYETPKPPRPRPRPWWPPGLFYPGRAGDGLVTTIALGTVLWLGGTLVPEYCLALLADGTKLGAISVGRLVALISGLPALILLPFVLLYWLAYLTCVIEASAEGEALPPRPPGRGLGGLLGGMTHWVLWLVLGVGVGLLPLWAFLAAVWQGAVSWNVKIALGLALAGSPYLLMALLLCVLHDDPLGTSPWRVVGKIVRLAPSFLGLLLTGAAMLGLVAAAFAGTLALRTHHFWIYIVVSLASWLCAVWMSLVLMHTLGGYFLAHRKQFR